MHPNTTPDSTIVEFASDGSKVAPSTALDAAGYLVNEQLPAEHLNFFLSKLTQGRILYDDAVKSLLTELNNIITQGGGTPNNSLYNQLKTALDVLYQAHANGASWQAALSEVLGQGHVPSSSAALAIASSWNATLAGTGPNAALGANWATFLADNPSNVWRGEKVLLTSGSGNWTVPAGVRKIRVTCVGGGGGGGGAGSGTGGGGGGGGGTSISSVMSDVLTCTPGASLSYSVGVGGNGGAKGTGSNPGSDGQSGSGSSFSGVSSTKGLGAGPGYGGSSDTSGCMGGKGGSGPDYYVGSAGSPGVTGSTSYGGGAGGSGGGAGGMGASYGGSSGNTGGYGGGGGGGGVNGGRGGNGVIIIEY